MKAIRYIIFAIISTLINLAAQYVSFWIYNGISALYVALFAGTLSGLVVKYILDKKYIFFHTPKNKKDDGKKFILYSLMGILTTSVFWGFEIGFDYLSDNENAKYIGAVIGLAIGYIIKYKLDQRFVFKE